MDILLPIIIIVIVIQLGAWFLRRYLEQQEELVNRVYNHLEKILHIVEEKHIEDQIYWYDETSGEFLAQGRTEREIIEILRSRFPKHHFLFMDSDGEEVVARIAAPAWQREPVQLS